MNHVPTENQTIVCVNGVPNEPGYTIIAAISGWREKYAYLLCYFISACPAFWSDSCSELCRLRSRSLSRRFPLGRTRTDRGGALARHDTCAELFSYRASSGRPVDDSPFRQRLYLHAQGLRHCQRDLGH